MTDPAAPRSDEPRALTAVREAIHRRLGSVPVWTHRPDPEAAPGSQSAQRFETVRPSEVAEAVDAAFAQPTFDSGGSVIFDPAHPNGDLAASIPSPSSEDGLLREALDDWADDFDEGWGDKYASGDFSEGGFGQMDHGSAHVAREFRLLRVARRLAIPTDPKDAIQAYDYEDEGLGGT